MPADTRSYLNPFVVGSGAEMVINGSTIDHMRDLYDRGRQLMKYPDTFRRFFGETAMNAEPMITGFGILFFTDLPEPLEAEAGDADYLTAMTTSLDVPDMSVDVITYEGRDGGQWHVPGAVKMGGALSLNMWEMRGALTHRIIGTWIHIMRNPHYGFMTETTWRQKNYKGKLTYAICNPDLEVQVAKVYSGIWPTNLRDSAFKMDQNQEKIEYQVEFQFDHYPYTSQAIVEGAQGLVNQTIHSLGTIVNRKFADAAKVTTNAWQDGIGADLNGQTDTTLTSGVTDTTINRA